MQSTRTVKGMTGRDDARMGGADNGADNGRDGG